MDSKLGLFLAFLRISQGNQFASLGRFLKKILIIKLFFLTGLALNKNDAAMQLSMTASISS